MGQAVLRNHEISGSEKDSVGFWCDAKAARKGMPTSDQILCKTVSAEAGVFARQVSPGCPSLSRTSFQKLNHYTYGGCRSELLLSDPNGKTCGRGRPHAY